MLSIVGATVGDQARRFDGVPHGSIVGMRWRLAREGVRTNDDRLEAERRRPAHLGDGEIDTLQRQDGCGKEALRCDAGEVASPVVVRSREGGSDLSVGDDGQVFEEERWEQERGVDAHRVQVP
ncbi:MAG: hypothetical protein HY261_08705 [Chloroflexi bacterium]|nr:hypothetical protein [Chloroflexota bacterium]